MLATFCDSRKPDQLVWLWNGLRKWEKETWKTKEDMARYIERRFGRDGCGLQ